MKRPLVLLIIGLIAVNLFFIPMSAAWQSNGVPVYTDAKAQERPVVCSDGAGGAIIAWEDYRNGPYRDIYAQRIGSSGQILWNVNGTLICQAGHNQEFLQICSDGVGGAILTWIDYRAGGPEPNIYAQRVDSQGHCLWTTNGVVICNATEIQDTPVLCSDGHRGAIIVWVDYRNGTSSADIFAQHINENGNITWPLNGEPITSAMYNQVFPQLVSDGAGGAIICWQNYYGLAADIYAQKINANGVVQWAKNGVVVCNYAQNQYSPLLCTDETGGAILVWQDLRTDAGDIFAQRMNSAGSPQWTDNGIVVCNATLTQQGPSICSDDSGGAFISWMDMRSGIDYDIYAQRIRANGQPAWTANGEIRCNATGNQAYPQMCRDGAGGAIIAWGDQRDDASADIYAQRFDATKEIEWQFNGATVCNHTGNDLNYQLVSAGRGAAIFVWQDGRNDDIYALKIASPLEGADPAVLLLLLIIPLIGISMALFILYKRRTPLE